jgi:hypothetical protein
MRMIEERYRLPLVPMCEYNRQKLRAILEELDLI